MWETEFVIFSFLVHDREEVEIDENFINCKSALSLFCLKCFSSKIKRVEFWSTSRCWFLGRWKLNSFLFLAEVRLREPRKSERNFDLIRRRRRECNTGGSSKGASISYRFRFSSYASSEKRAFILHIKMYHGNTKFYAISTDSKWISAESTMYRLFSGEWKVGIYFFSAWGLVGAPCGSSRCCTSLLQLQVMARYEEVFLWNVVDEPGKESHNKTNVNFN